MVLKNIVNFGSGKGLLPDSTKPLPEPMLSHHQQVQQQSPNGVFHKRYTSAFNHQN